MLVDIRRNFGQPDSNMERQLMPRPVAVASGPTDWNEALDIISFGSPEQVHNNPWPLFVIIIVASVIKVEYCQIR